MPKYTSLCLGLVAIVTWSSCQSPESKPTPPAPAAALAAPMGEVAAASTTPRVPGDDEPLEALPNVEDLMESLGLEGTKERVALGRQLFHDTRLSADHTVSCATCHDLRFGGIDRTQLAVGIRNQVGPVNTPTVFNAALGIAQFWDGRAKDLAAQASGPPQAAGEMGSNFEDITAKLRADADCVAAFQRAFPGEVESANDVTTERILEAIATFEATLLTPDSRFDRWLGGEHDSLTDEELRGYALFKEVGCAECHYGPAVGGKTFQKLGHKVTYFNAATLSHADNGRFNVTNDERDRHSFKVPSLRNVALTAPYLHDGSVKNLEEAVRVMAKHQLGMDLGERQVKEIGAFLRTLTGTYEGQSLDPSAR